MDVIILGECEFRLPDQCFAVIGIFIQNLSDEAASFLVAAVSVVKAYLIQFGLKLLIGSHCTVSPSEQEVHSLAEKVNHAK